MPELRLQRTRESYPEPEPIVLDGEPIVLKVRQSWLDEQRHLLTVAERISLAHAKYVANPDVES